MDKEDILSTLSDEELDKICHKLIDTLAGFNLNLASKYLVVKTLYESFLDICRKEGYNIVEFKRKQ